MDCLWDWRVIVLVVDSQRIRAASRAMTSNLLKEGFALRYAFLPQHWYTALLTLPIAELSTSSAIPSSTHSILALTSFLPLLVGFSLLLFEHATINVTSGGLQSNYC